MKLLTATTLALSLCVGTVLPVAAENIVGTVKAGSTCRQMAGNQLMVWTTIPLATRCMVPE